MAGGSEGGRGRRRGGESWEGGRDGGMETDGREQDSTNDFLAQWVGSDA